MPSTTIDKVSEQIAPKNNDRFKTIVRSMIQRNEQLRTESERKGEQIKQQGQEIERLQKQLKRYEQLLKEKNELLQEADKKWSTVIGCLAISKKRKERDGDEETKSD
eukprot:CAMPEP_0178947074 /NCGR_PEP_ID=MMETSP0789-20121207/4640_1 /TAXON_ID=3005 /ORGANISM="Rhizosolenia setigera, Strain CCMP 1694" /LENGTH=106 /DNA_ID=CAMNT_0020627139 /DNA_START=96 /DNA_END=416 /DNA_ORIENTATION=-